MGQYASKRKDFSGQYLMVVPSREPKPKMVQQILAWQILVVDLRSGQREARCAICVAQAL